MKLDTKSLRYLTPEDWRVLTAVEMGSKNHEIVPTSMIDKIARLRGGSSGVHKSISTLAKAGLIGRIKEAKYDGYRLTYGGLDYLAMHTHSQRDIVYSVGHRVGVGKESDIVMVADKTGQQRILKIHRLGRISFRTVKSNRDYLKRRQGGSWMYLSRLSAMREYAFLDALRKEGFPVPEPFAQSRHTIVMSFVDNALPLRQVSAVPDPAALYAELIGLILRLAQHGLIHGDFNEFNIMIQEQKPAATDSQRDTSDGAEENLAVVPILIDFPQMVSMEHKNAEMYFDRDVACVKRFFERRFHFIATQPGPFFKDARATVGQNGATRIDIAVEASGFTKKMSKDLEAAILEQQNTEFSDADEDDEDESGEEDEEEDQYEEDEEKDESKDTNDKQLGEEGVPRSGTATTDITVAASYLSLDPKA
ncbi:Atypical/RIO/RIO2 protein kinase [Sporothrix schenckii ATCC 58251]|uniref:Serine/threonine-protein kinase RIO2 n=1 Tax=Sporothrix schenckii (strain ATCC 58251 / de Perez 2211183) TaxID=1391915 RepID=U7PRZ9_SPOS1|nr:Atypical/RIO/RIO2 protein kinase [Sporothrix schenckii ATCC 58251]